MSAKKYPILLTAVTLLLLAMAWSMKSTPVLSAPQAKPPLQAQTTPAPSGQPVGALYFTDNEAARTGRFVLQLNSFQAAPAGSHYELWLRADDGDQLVTLDSFAVNNGRALFQDDSDQALLATYNSALISIEPDDDTEEGISPQIVLSSTLPLSLTAAIRPLFFASERNDKGFLTGASEQVQLAVQHTGFLYEQLINNNFTEARRHAEHIVNILDGEEGEFYNNWDRDAQLQNPGDGFGVRAYLAEASTQLSAVDNALTATEALTASHRQAEVAMTAVAAGQALVPVAIEQALKIFSADTITEAHSVGDELRVIMEEMGAKTASAYTTTQQIAVYRFYANPAPETAPELSPAPTLIPTPTLGPTATHTVAQSAPPPPMPQGAVGVTWTNGVDGAVYVYVPGGAFTMGAAPGTGIAGLEQPPHTVTVEGFWMQRTEVTNAQYGACVAAGGCTPPANEGWQQAAADLPVTYVDWRQAQAYAAWVGGRLPSEAEWERACRGDDARLFPWGSEPPTPQRANYNNNVNEPAPMAVGSYPDGASPYGLLDLSGNVWEWTTTLEQPYPYDAADGREDPAADGKRILRGGSFYYTQYQLHCTTRSGFLPVTANQHFGFRVVVAGLSNEWTNGVDGAVYVYVPGGAFTMGAAPGTGIAGLEQPPHTVTVEGFWMQRTEVTNAQYSACVAAGGCTPPANEGWQQAAADLPVTYVDWRQAQAYAAWVGGRLPSEAEWERACRGDDARLFPWGSEPPTPQRANYNNNVNEPAPMAVGSYPDGASPYDLLDLSGNVWEWTTTLEQPYPYDATDGREDPAADGKRILRGGSFYYTQYQLHCTTRSGFLPVTANQHFGFRVVVSASGQ